MTEAGIIEKVPLNVQKDEEKSVTSIERLYRFNEAKLNPLNATEFAALRETGAFTHAMLSFSPCRN